MSHSSIAIILMGKRELVALHNLSSWCLPMVEWLFLTVPWGCLRFVIVVFPDHTQITKNPVNIIVTTATAMSTAVAVDAAIEFYINTLFFG